MTTNPALAAAIVGVFGLGAAPESLGFAGTSLLRRWSGGAVPEATPIIEIDEQRFERKSVPAQHGWIKSVLTPRWQYLVNEVGRLELYDLDRDPKQLHNVAETPEGKLQAQALHTKLEPILRTKSFRGTTPLARQDPSAAGSASSSRSADVR